MRRKFFTGLCYFGIFITIILAGLDVYYTSYKYTSGAITKSNLISDIFINLLCYAICICALIWMIVVRKNRK